MGRVTGRRPSLVTGIEMIELLATYPDGRGVADLAAHMGIDTGQAHRILAALREAGWVYQQEGQGPYRLTGRLLHVAGQLLEKVDLVRAARPLLIDLAAATGYTAGLMELRGDSLYLVAREHGHEAVQVVLRTGDPVPLHATAGGRAVLAALPPGVLLPGAGEVAADEDFQLRLKEVRRLGFSVDNEEFRSGVRTTAAAIIGHDQHPVGAIGIMAPSASVTKDALESLGPLVASSAAKISAFFGGHP